MPRLLFAAIAAIAVAVPALAGETVAPKDAKVYFVNLKDGDVVSNPVKVIFGLSGMGVAPAGVEKKNTGHHHLFINRPALGKAQDGKEELDFNIPADEKHVHFGGGQTETTLNLKPGKNTLQLVLGDMNHIPHKTPVVSPVITINVK